MKLNYLVQPRMAENFAFYARNDEEAKTTVIEHLQETQNYQATIYRWSREKKGWDYQAPLEIELPEVPSPRSIDFELSVSYFHHFQIQGVCTYFGFQEAVNKAAREHENNLSRLLPEIPGWTRSSLNRSQGIHLDPKILTILSVEEKGADE